MTGKTRLLALLTILLSVALVTTCVVVAHATTVSLSSPGQALVFNMTQIVSSTEKYTLLLANFTESYISLSSSTHKVIEIPPPIGLITISTTFTTARYTRDSYMVELKLYRTSGIIKMPIRIYEIYAGTASTVNFNIKVETSGDLESLLNAVSGPVYVSIIPAVSLDKVRDFVSYIINLGNVSELYNELVIHKVSTIQLGEEVPLNITLPEYKNFLIVVWKNVTNVSHVTIMLISVAYVIVATKEYKLDMKFNATSVTTGKAFNVTVTVPAASGDLVLVMMYATKYPLPLTVRSQGKVTNTEFLIYGVNITASRTSGTERYFTLFGIGLSKVGTETIQEKVLQILGRTYATVLYQHIQNVSLLVPTSGLAYGKYIVILFTWDPSTKKIYAVNYTYVTVLPPPLKAAPPPPPPPPVIVAKPVSKTKTTTVYAISKYMYMSPSSGVLVGTVATVNATSSDKELTVSIPKFTVPLVHGKPTVTLKMKIVSESTSKINRTLPPNIHVTLSKVYVISTYPSNVTFSKPVKVVFSVKPTMGKVYVLYYNETAKVWVPLPTKIVHNKAVAEVTQPGIVTVGKYAPPKVTNVVSVSLSVSSTTVTACTPITITVHVSVSSGSAADKVVMLYVNGRYIAYHITGPSGTVTFTYRTCSIGVFNIYAIVDGKKSNTATVFVYPLLG